MRKGAADGAPRRVAGGGNSSQEGQVDPQAINEGDRDRGGGRWFQHEQGKPVDEKTRIRFDRPPGGTSGYRLKLWGEEYLKVSH